MAFIYDLTDTWNAGGTTFNAIKMNVTDSASAAASKLVTLQVGGSEQFGVRKDGQGYFAGNVGIGTTSPGASVHIRTPAPKIRLTDTDTNAEAYINAQSSAGILSIEADETNVASGSAVVFRVDASERMRITSAGNVGIGTTSPNAAAQLDVTSTTRAFLPPRMTTAQRDAIASPPDGSVLYNSTIGALEVRQAGVWVNPTTAGVVNTPPSMETDFQNDFYTSRRSARTFDQLIDFTRTSSATFVGSNGLIQSTPASRNLLTFTQEFDHAAWTKGVGVTVTANAGAAPDLTNTADNVTFSAGGPTEFLRRGQTLTVGVTYTYSIYVRLVSGAPTFTFDVGNGAPSAAQTPTAVWQRFTHTFTFSGSNQWIDIQVSAAATLAFWGAQLELGSTASDYTRNYGGLFPPRFDYDPVTLAPRGLLIEEQRTNLVLRSGEFDNAAWTLQRSTVTANATTSPDGTADADRLVDDTATGTHRIYQAVAKAASAIAYTASVYVKADTLGFATLRIAGVVEAAYTSVGINLTTGELSALSTLGFTSASAAVSNAGNGWWRLQLTGTSDTTTTISALVGTANSLAANSSYTGTGSGSIYLWGAQLEAGAFATSYIPTVASQVTRTAETALIQAPNFAPWYNQSEGSFVVEATLAAIPAGATTGRFLEAFSPGSADRQPMLYTTNTGSITVTQTVATVGQAFMQPGTMVAGQPFKLASCYRTDDFAASFNAGAVVKDTSGSVASNIASLGIGYGASSPADRVPTHIRSIRYYPVRLSDAQLQALTA